MIPKIASALARVLDPIKPIQRPGQSLSLMKSSEGGEGGHGALGYDPHNNRGQKEEKTRDPKAVPEEGEGDSHSETLKEARVGIQPGLTQMILEMSGKRNELAASTAVHSYETGAKEQKKNSRLPKGSMLDKKVG